MTLVVDNHDSFTYNLVDIVAQTHRCLIQYPDDDNVLNQSVDVVIIFTRPWASTSGRPTFNEKLSHPIKINPF